MSPQGFVGARGTAIFASPPTRSTAAAGFERLVGSDRHLAGCFCTCVCGRLSVHARYKEVGLHPQLHDNMTSPDGYGHQRAIVNGILNGLL